MLFRFFYIFGKVGMRRSSVFEVIKLGTLNKESSCVDI